MTDDEPKYVPPFTVDINSPDAMRLPEPPPDEAPTAPVQPFAAPPIPTPSTAQTQPVMPFPLEEFTAADAPTTENLAQFQPVQVSKPITAPAAATIRVAPRTRLNFRLLLLASILLAVVVYLFIPLRTNLLVLGIDQAPDGTYAGRSDTMILVTTSGWQPYVGMLSIPRDLWVNIAVPGAGQNRINTAHFFAEANQPGSGPYAALATVEQNFGVRVPYYVRIRFDGFVTLVDAIGGVRVTLTEPMAGFAPGEYKLSGKQTLAFVRSRQGSDDFYRMSHTQFIIKVVIMQMISPSGILRMPDVLRALPETIDTNLPPLLLPRLGFGLLRAGLDGIDARTIDRTMTRGFTTSGGAQVQEPIWENINPLIQEMFRK